MNKVFNWAMAVTVIFMCLSIVTLPSAKEIQIDIEDIETGIGLIDVIEEGRIETLVYKEVEGKTLEIDFYEPMVQVFDQAPVVVFLHGGSWVAGNKESIANGDRKVLVHELRNQGYAVAAVEYRTYNPTLSFYDSIVDCQDAIRFIRKVSDERGYNSNKIGYWGTSAGGHLGLLAATLDYDSMASPDLKDYPCDIDFFVAYYTPTSLPALIEAQAVLDEEMVKSFVETVPIGGTVEALVDKGEQYSPINHIEDIDFPVLMIQGTSDRIVPYENLEKFQEAFVQTNPEVSFTSMLVEGAGHGFLKLKTRPEDRERIIDTTLDFITSQ